MRRSAQASHQKVQPRDRRTRCAGPVLSASKFSARLGVCGPCTPGGLRALHAQAGAGFTSSPLRNCIHSGSTVRQPGGVSILGTGYTSSVSHAPESFPPPPPFCLPTATLFWRKQPGRVGLNLPPAKLSTSPFLHTSEASVFLCTRSVFPRVVWPSLFPCSTCRVHAGLALWDRASCGVAIAWFGVALEGLALRLRALRRRAGSRVWGLALPSVCTRGLHAACRLALRAWGVWPTGMPSSQVCS